MARLEHEKLNKNLRKARVRAVISGTSERPRVTVTISNLHISAQVIDDTSHKTLVSSTTVGSKNKGTMTEKAATIGKDIAVNCKKAKIKAVVFDRNGRRYAGRLKAFVDAIREEGIKV